MINSNELKSISHNRIINFSQELDHLSFFTDTRTYNNERVFIAIEGDNFKPLNFIENIHERCIIICEKTALNEKIIKENSKRSFIVVNDSIEALKEISSLICRKFQENSGKLIAISGSNGKTTTKEMLTHLLSSIGKTVCTQKNNNNHIGVPLTVFQIKSDTRFCIVELGSNHPGEIQYLVDMIEPQYGICTNIGETHLEFFENVENVFQEESYLCRYLEEHKKLCFLNLDDEYLENYKNYKNKISFGKDPDADAVYSVGANTFRLNYQNHEFNFENNHITGEHNKINMLSAVLIASQFIEDIEKLKVAVKTFIPTPNRSQWLELNNTKIFLDAYNANPSSMRAAIYAFREKCMEMGLKKEEFALVLGDMNELGPRSETYHEEIGKFCSQNGIGNLYFVGRYAHSYNKGSNYQGAEFLTTEQLKTKMKNIVPMHKAILIKGSRSLQLESAVDITLC